MSFKSSLDITPPELKQLWGSFVPSLTPEQIDLAVQLCPKIKQRK